MSDYFKAGDQLIYVKDLISEPGATGILSDYQDHTDPKYIGPGTWNILHRRAFKARTKKQQLEFIEFMKDVCYGFPCFVCKGHCTEYIKNHPMEEYVGMLVDINDQRIALGLFVWTWKFHNAVNTRINKPIMGWDTAYNLYSDKENLVCSKNCHDAGDQPADGLELDSPPKLKLSPMTPKLSASKISIPIPKSSNSTFRLISMKRK